MLPKIEKVLYATDLTLNSAYALRYAVNTALKHNAQIYILHVVEPLPPRVKSQLQVPKETIIHQIEERLKQFTERELKDNPESIKRVVGIYVVQGDPSTEIINKTDELGCDTIIIGTHGKGAIGRTLSGSVSERVLHHTHKPLYIIPLPKGETDISMGQGNKVVKVPETLLTY